jgi:hypothetical protein
MNPASQTTAGELTIPKIIWIFWQQGVENAPALVRQCVASWKKYNPEWQVIVLDEQNMAQHAVIPPVTRENCVKVSRQALSEVLRINLLAQHGGVWADATCLCCQPLDKWLHDCTRSGFFAFAQPAKDRLLSSWFLVARQSCPLTRVCAEMVNDYFAHNARPLKSRFAKSIAKRLVKIAMCSPRLASYLVHPRLVKTFPVNPYFCFQYIFYRMIATNEQCRRIWEATPKISADGPHAMQHQARNPITPDIQAIINARRDPVYKLNWRLKNWPPDSVLEYLLRTV